MSNTQQHLVVLFTYHKNVRGHQSNEAAHQEVEPRRRMRVGVQHEARAEGEGDHGEAHRHEVAALHGGHRILSSSNKKRGGKSDLRET